MSQRFGRKRRRALQAALESKSLLARELDERLASSTKMVLHLQRELRDRGETVRQRDEALRLLAAGHAARQLGKIVAEAHGQFMRQALSELERTGIDRMRVSLETRPFAGPQMRDARVVTVVIPQVDWHAVVTEEKQNG